MVSAAWAAEEGLFLSVVCTASEVHIGIHDVAATRDHDDVSRPGCHQGPCCGQVDVSVQCCWQMPRGSPWSVILLTVKDKEVSSAVVAMTADLRKRDIKSFHDNTPPPKKVIIWTGSYLNELLKFVMRMLTCISPQKGVENREGFTFLWELDLAPVTIWTTQIEFFLKYVFEKEALIVGKEPRRSGKWGWLGALCENCK